MPEKWKPFWHFYNVPISGNQSSPNSVVSFIKNLAVQEDFVSFKLDIDSPINEIPIALDILNDASITSLIDEFFFELHYRCDIMMYCGKNLVDYLFKSTCIKIVCFYQLNRLGK